MSHAKPKSPVKHATSAAEIPSQASGESHAEPAEMGDPRALRLLDELGEHQKGLPRGTALAWERAVFAEAFLDPEPQRRVRAFLRKEK